MLIRIILAIGALFDVPELGWLAIGLLAADVVSGAVVRRGKVSPPAVLRPADHPPGAVPPAPA